MFQFLYFLIKLIQPILVPVCFFCAWALILILFWGLWTSIRDSLGKAKQMHEIPCTGCQFFTNDYRLKCTVNPFVANSEDAIDCPDYRANYPYSRRLD